MGRFCCGTLLSAGGRTTDGLANPCHHLQLTLSQALELLGYSDLLEHVGL